MLSNPLISIITPCYNAASFINETISSVLRQSYSNFEWIIVNDASTDDTESIILSYPDKRIHYYIQDKKGASVASNYGLKLAKGDFIKFLDADDLLNDCHLEKMLESIQSESMGLASCSWGAFHDGDYKSAKFIKESTWRDCSSLDWILSALRQRTENTSLWLWLIPKSIIDKVGGYDESLTLNNDFEFSIRILLHAQKVVFVDEAKLYYRLGNKNSLSISSSHSAIMSAYKSTILSYSHIQKKYSLADINLLFANRLAIWLFRFYPEYPDLANMFHQKIKQLGGSNVRFLGSKKINMMSKLLGWKMTKRLQHYYYKLRY